MEFSQQNARVKTDCRRAAATLRARQENTQGKEGSEHKRKSGEKWSAGYKELSLGAVHGGS